MFQYSVGRSIPTTIERAFDIVAHVENYPHFVPGWKAVRTRSISETEYLTDQVVQWSLLRLHFKTHTTLNPYHSIHVSSRTPPFKRFDLNWHFSPSGDGDCFIELDVEIETSTRLLEKRLKLLLSDRLDQLLHAFEKEALRDKAGQ